MKRKLLGVGLSIAITLTIASCSQKPAPAQEPEQPTAPAVTEPLAEPKQEEPKEPAVEVMGKMDQGENTDVGELVSLGEVTPIEEVVPENLFDEVNEDVYATGTVNIRLGYSMESEKLGQLSQGDSVKRIGIGKLETEAEEWSQVQLSDGRIVYIASSYLSTTKPVQTQSQTQSSKPQSQQTQQNQQTQSQNKTQTPQQNQVTSDGGVVMPLQPNQITPDVQYTSDTGYTVTFRGKATEEAKQEAADRTIRISNGTSGDIYAGGEEP